MSEHHSQFMSLTVSIYCSKFMASKEVELNHSKKWEFSTHKMIRKLPNHLIKQTQKTIGISLQPDELLGTFKRQRVL